MKRLVIVAGFGDRLIEFCHVCGIEQPLVWWAPNALWSELTGEQPVQGGNMPGVLCPRCFAARAESRGILLRWHPVVEHRRDVAPRLELRPSAAPDKASLDNSDASVLRPHPETK